MVLGASGFVGQRLLQAAKPYQAVGTYNRNPIPDALPFDVAHGSVDELLRRLPHPITHASVLAGISGTEACARDPAGTDAINVEGIWRVVRGLLDAGIVPIYISTDYVFDGSHPNWREDDPALPTTRYGRQKLAVEMRMRADPRPSAIVRLSRVVGTDWGANNILGAAAMDIRAGKTLRCARDQVFSPVGVDDVAGALLALAVGGATGTFHLAGPAAFSRMQLLRLLAKAIRTVDPAVAPELVPCALHELPFTETLPLYTSLATDKLHATISWRFTPMPDLCAQLARRHFGAG